MIDSIVAARTVKAVERALSTQQKQVFLRAGNRLVTACPGAGKTRGIAGRASLLMSHGERVALTTFTNVGAEEIRRAVEAEFETAVGDDSYIGTLHGFLLRYVYRPHAAAEMRSHASPLIRIAKSDSAVVGEKWSYATDDFTLLADGSMRYNGRTPWGMTKESAAEEFGDDAKKLKEEEAASGYSNANDALYWCLKVLENAPDIASAVASRFDELIIDEAQDTSELQAACLEKIVNSEALRSLILVGDFDQSIYSFQGASTQNVVSLSETAKLDPIPLTENHRSSQLICNVTARLRTAAEPDTAVGPSRANSHRPKLLFYDEARLDSLPSRFVQALEKQRMDARQSAVIARGNALLSELSGAERVYYDKNGLFGALVDVLRYPRLSAWRLHHLEDLLKEESTRLGLVDLRSDQLRDGLMRVLDAAHSARDSTFEAWSSVVMSSVAEVLTQVRKGAATTNVDLRAPEVGPDELMSKFLTEAPDLPIELATVHAVKGRSLQTTLVVADHFVPRNRPVEWRTWRGFFEGIVNEGDDEEFRILYVALTRASQRCFVALPKAARESRTLDVFEAAGFEVPRS